MTIADAWLAGRAEHEQNRREGRPSIVAAAVKAAAKRLPRWRDARRPVLTVAGLAAIDYSVFDSYGRGWGAAAVGVSLLILEVLTSDERTRR